MKVTSFDVARAAGVSQSTVSRALSGSASISATTVRRVRAVAEELHYVPSDRARHLSTQRTSRVAMIVDLDNPLWSLLVGRAHDLLAEHQYRLSLVAEHGDPVEIESHVLGGSVDGVIVASALLRSQLPELLLQRSVPTVLLHRFSEAVDLDASVADDRRGGLLAARVLLAQGHRSIGALFGPETASTARERESGFTDELTRSGVSLSAGRLRHGPYTFDYGHRAVTGMIAGEDLPEALFCANDSIALGALNAAHEHGVRVPGDLALVGFDDLVESGWPVVDLTSIHVPFDEMLHTAVALLFERIAEPDRPPRRVVHPVHLRERSSHRRT